MKELNQLEKDFQEFNTKSAEFKAKLNDAPEIERKEQELNEFESLKSLFGNLIIQRNEAAKESLERDNALKVFKAELLNYQEINRVNEIEYRKYERVIITHEELNQNADRLKKIISAKSKELHLVETQSQINKLEESFKLNITIKRKELTDKISVLELLNESLQNFPLDDTYINALNEWYLKMEHFTDLLKKANESKEAKEKEYKTLILSLKKLITENGSVFIKNIPEDISEEEFKNAIEDFRKTSENIIEKFRTEKADLDVKLKLHEYANHLEDGMPCVLCGSMEHPSPIEIEKLDDSLVEINEKIDKEVLLLKKLDEFKVEGLRYFQSVKTALVNLETAKDEQNKTKDNFLKVQDSLPEGKYSLEHKSEFKEAVNKIASNRKLIGENITSIKKLKDNLMILVEKAESEEKQIAELNKNVIINTTQLEALQGEVPEGLWNDKKILSAEILEAEVNEITETVKRNNDNFNKFKKLFEESAKSVTELSAKVETAGKEVEKATFKLTEVKTALDLALIENKSDEAKIGSILEKNLNVQEIRKEIEDFKKLKNTLEGEINVLKEKISKKQYNKEEHDTIKSKVITLLDSVEKLKTSTVEMATILERMERDLISKNDLQGKYEKLLIRAEDIKTINKLFKGRGFVEFISRKHLQNVVAVANSRFYKMTRQKFKMELSADAEFLVRDYMNEGKTRLLKSLSGGQTFQAALCLALALSESIQRNAGISQQFFFLDEGFGTLDKESLQTVFETLKSLRQENRVVGLISHVEELQQEMDVFLNIENDADLGTKIKGSWEL